MEDESLSKILVNHSLKLKKSEKVLIELNGISGINLVRELLKECKRVGAYPFFNIIENDLLKLSLECYSKESLIQYAELDLERMKKMDAYIGINACENNFELANIETQIMNDYNNIYIKPIHFDERVKNKKWCILRYPTNLLAEKSKMSLQEFKQYYYNVCCDIDYNVISKKMDVLVRKLNKTNKIQIKSNDTDLVLYLNGMNSNKYVGNFNLPDCEVATAPNINRVDGYIAFNTDTCYNGNFFSNIKLVFKEGKVISALCENGNLNKLIEILNEDDGSRYVGEFAFGLNPKITKAIGDPLFDEKIIGSIHIALGNSIPFSDNGNSSSIHWDLVKILRKEYGGGEIFFDDELIVKDGKFVENELKYFNDI